MKKPYLDQVTETFSTSEPTEFGDAHIIDAEFGALRQLYETRGRDRDATLESIKQEGYPMPEYVTPEMVALSGAAHACGVAIKLARERGEAGKDATYESYTTKNRFDRFTDLHLPAHLRQAWRKPSKRLPEANSDVEYPENVAIDSIHGIAKPHRYLPAQTMRHLEFARLGKLDDATKEIMSISDVTDLDKFTVEWDSLIPVIESATDVTKLAGELGAAIGKRLLDNGLSQEQVAAILKKSYSIRGIKEEHGDIEEADNVLASLIQELGSHEETIRIGDMILDSEHEQSHETLGFTIGDVKTKDLPALRPILEQWVRRTETNEIVHDEIDSIIENVTRSIEGTSDNSRRYIVARDASDTLVGIIGMTEPETAMKAFATTDNPVELVNAFVDRDQRRNDIGRQLVEQLEQMAVSSGYSELIVNSGPRYEHTGGWDFWIGMFGEPIVVAKDFYDTGVDAPVWTKRL